MLDYAKSKGCYTVWFTDSETFMQTPVKPYDQVVQYATHSAMLSFTALVALYNVINYLVAVRLNDSMESISHTEEMLFPASGSSTSFAEGAECTSFPFSRDR